MKFLQALNFMNDTVYISVPPDKPEINIDIHTKNGGGTTTERLLTVDIRREIILKREEGRVILGLTDE